MGKKLRYHIASVRIRASISINTGLVKIFSSKMCITCVRYVVYNLGYKEELLLNLKGWKKMLRNMRTFICKAGTFIYC